MTHEKEFEKLKKFVAERENYVRNDVFGESAVWSHQAYGAVEMFCRLFPEDEDEVGNWWNDDKRNNFYF